MHYLCLHYDAYGYKSESADTVQKTELNNEGGQRELLNECHKDSQLHEIGLHDMIS